MSTRQKIKIFLFNSIFVLLSVILFSKGFMGLSVTSSNTAAAAFSITLIGMGVIIFVIGNYRMIKVSLRQVPYLLDELDEPKEFAEALESHRDKKVFLNDIDTIIRQMDSLERKKKSLETVLYQKYQNQMNEFESLKQVVDDTNNLVFENNKKILSRMAIFDQKEYDSLHTNVLQNTSDDAKISLYQQHILYIRSYVAKNESILLQFDKLLIEVSEIGDTGHEEKGMEALEDTVAAMKNLRRPDSELEDLESKYKI